MGKTFNATGWRVGYVIGNESLIKHVQWAHVLLSYVTAGPAQEAAAVAYEEAETREFWDSNRQDFKRKVDNLCLFLSDLGLPVYISTLPLELPFPTPYHLSFTDDRCQVYCAFWGVLRFRQHPCDPPSGKFRIPKSSSGQAPRLEDMLVHCSEIWCFINTWKW